MHANGPRELVRFLSIAFSFLFQTNFISTWTSSLCMLNHHLKYFCNRAMWTIMAWFLSITFSIFYQTPQTNFTFIWASSHYIHHLQFLKYAIWPSALLTVLFRYFHYWFPPGPWTVQPILTQWFVWYFTKSYFVIVLFWITYYCVSLLFIGLVMNSVWEQHQQSFKTFFFPFGSVQIQIML